MSGALILAVTALGLLQQTDTVVPVAGAERLAVEAPGGSITVTTWSRPDVRIQASHATRTRVEVERRGSTLRVGAEARIGPAIIDYTLTVPPSLALDLEGRTTVIQVEGVEAEVSAETVQGDIRIVGGRGTVRASTVAGGIVVEDAGGRVELELVAGDARVIGARGEVYAETVGGDLTFEDARVRIVEAGTVGGRIIYDGALQSGGRYSFASHGGSVDVRVPSGAGATFSLATFHGNLHSDLPGAPARLERGERTRFTVGDGGAAVEVETFGGDITLMRRTGAGGTPR